MNFVEPPLYFTTDEAGSQYIYGRPGTRDGIMVDKRIWQSRFIHIWIPNKSKWIVYKISDYNRIKVLLECL